MEKVVSFDKQGRLYVPEEMRKSLGFTTGVLTVRGNSLVIEPIHDDPIEALGKLGKEKLKGKSIADLRKMAQEDIGKHALKKVC